MSKAVDNQMQAMINLGNQVQVDIKTFEAQATMWRALAIYQTVVAKGRLHVLVTANPWTGYTHLIIADHAELNALDREITADMKSEGTRLFRITQSGGKAVEMTVPEAIKWARKYTWLDLYCRVCQQRRVHTYDGPKARTWRCRCGEVNGVDSDI